MPLRILVAALVLGLVAAAAYYFIHPWFEKPPPPAASARTETPAPPAAGPKYPIGADARALPNLNESDPALREGLAGVIDPRTLEKFFDLEDGVRHIVATIDNLPRETIASRLDPVKPVPGRFATSGKGDTLMIDRKNAARYDALVDLAEKADTAKLVSAYVYLYPLFQQAYVGLGYPNGYFNDRLIEVIDHLLEAPEVAGPILLVQPHVLYEYADVDLESLSAGRKILVRVGKENAARLKAKLKEIRARLVAASTPR